jgi:hypothetical protein
MEIKNDIEIKIESRGSLRQRLVEKTLKESYEDVENNIAGEEFLFKKLHILNKDDSYYDTILETLFSGFSGLYLPDTKELVLLKGVNKRRMSSVLLHELIHAAQDSYVDLGKISSANQRSHDASMAVSSLVEGHDQALIFLINISKRDVGQSTHEIFEQMIVRFNNEPDDSDADNLFIRQMSFPYTYGLKFALQLYTTSDKKDFKKMLDRFPLSTEQVLHFDKFMKNEKPLTTTLQNQDSLFVAATKEMYTTTLGEYFIKTLFDITLKKDKKLNSNASEGWGGDHIRVFKSNEKMFFVWDTLWDTEKDAKEFFTRYKTFAKKRFNTKELFRFKSFDAAHPEQNPQFLVKIRGTRVLVIEGDIEDHMIDKITETLGI